VRRKGSGIAFVLPQSRDDATAPSDSASAAAPAPTPRAAPRTGVGLLATTVFETNKLEQRIESLEGEVRKLEAERGGQLLDARTIVASHWANRHPDSFVGADFEALKREIQDAGGNVQPIKVRPLAPGRTEGVDGTARYEIVFGHRRHRACLELGLPVLAIIQDLKDQDLFVHMERENRGRQSLSAWEQGRMYLRALNEGLFPSNRQLAAAIGRDISDIGKALRIAQLPPEVVGAFPSPNAIQFRWAADLHKALEKNADAVLGAARDTGIAQGRLSAGDVFQALTACLKEQLPKRSSATVQEMNFGDGRRGTIKTDAAGRTIIELDPHVLPENQWKSLEAALRKLLS
jgi:ParB family chromosome partitioning protein